MGIYDRIQEVRKQRNIGQKVFASMFGISVASYGRKEKGKEGGFNPDMLDSFVRETNIDARFLFGQIDDFNAADLNRTEPEDKRLQREMLEAVQEYNTLRTPADDEDKVIEAVRTRMELYTLCERLQGLSTGEVRIVEGIAAGLIAGKDQAEAKEPSKVTQAPNPADDEAQVALSRGELPRGSQ